MFQIIVVRGERYQAYLCSHFRLGSRPIIRSLLALIGPRSISAAFGSNIPTDLLLLQTPVPMEYRRRIVLRLFFSQEFPATLVFELHKQATFFRTLVPSCPRYLLLRQGQLLRGREDLCTFQRLPPLLRSIGRGSRVAEVWHSVRVEKFPPS